MAYLCLDCSHRANTKFPGGKCPACDSFNVQFDKVKSDKLESDKTHQQERKTLLEYIILVLFWGVLLWGIWDRYLK